ncbi:CsbD family protein [Kitasatospora sp. NPDC057223]|uniref:CsbD family protein n=1 Tax=Kitasatospora sp. NPDC057223 TaxID=3346055 RepID=UPI0036405AF8
MSTGDKIENSGEKLKGAAKEAAGKAVGNEHLRAEGRADQAEADIKQAGEHAKDALKG